MNAATVETLKIKEFKTFKGGFMPVINRHGSRREIKRYMKRVYDGKMDYRELASLANDYGYGHGDILIIAVEVIKGI